MKTFRPIPFLIVLFIGFILGTGYGMVPQSILQTVPSEEIAKEEGLYSPILFTVWEEIQANYVDPEIFSEQEPFEYGMIKGLLLGLDDPYSYFMTPDENNDFQESLQGNFQGIGAELTVIDGAITIVTPLKDSPAQNAGLMPDDIIIKVNTEDITKMGLLSVVAKIRGEKGTVVELEVFRPSISDTKIIEVTRDVIKVDSVESEWFENIALIEINQFGETTVKEFYTHLSKILEKKPEGIIVDLRYNGGGYLEGAINISSAFLPANVDVVTVKGRSDEVPNVSRMTRIKDTKTPLIVLINKGSASASEIVAGALQDHNRAIILGEQSFGKGTVQEVLPLPKGAALRVTVAKWYTPDDHGINKEGITPDVFVEKTIEDSQEKRKPQLNAALEIFTNNNWQTKINELIELEKNQTPSTETKTDK
ncbi:peptidase S41 [Candidatus Peregrinibacteria bacterium]|nr:MAG: peptidase S41 [Candidatus Peregrinibacteria bacterium]